MTCIYNLKRSTLLLFTALLSGLSTQIAAQTYPYTFSHFNAEYIPLTNGTTVEACNDEITPAAIGFNFPYLGINLDTLSIHNTFLIQEMPVENVITGAQIFPFGAGYSCSVSDTTEVSYSTVNENGNAVFIVQWKNLGFFEDSTGEQFINLQLKMYDIDKAIEVRFGGMNITSNNIYFTNATGGFTALIKYTNPSDPIIDPNSISLYENAGQPIMDFYYPNQEIFLIGHPDSAMVYRFAPEQAGLDDNSLPSLSISPNPATDFIAVQGLHKQSSANIRILTTDGQFIRQEKLTQNVNGIPVSDLKTGIYLLEILQEDRTEVVRFMKK
jgi:hypothetical protein